MNWINPPVTVSTLIIRDGKVLVGKRKLADGFGKYDMPGGFLESGESLETAARREVFEETSIDLTGVRVDYLMSRPSRYPDGREILCVHFMASTNQSPVDSDELCDYEWIDHVPDMSAESDAEAMRRYFGMTKVD